MKLAHDQLIAKRESPNHTAGTFGLVDVGGRSGQDGADDGDADTSPTCWAKFNRVSDADSTLLRLLDRWLALVDRCVAAAGRPRPFTADRKSDNSCSA